ncbi:UDP-glycosyltransferase 89A2 [Bienertia sinuspersici]
MLESTMASVMLLGWPIEADQFVNAKQLVEYKGLIVKLVKVQTQCQYTQATPKPS